MMFAPGEESGYSPKVCFTGVGVTDLGGKELNKLIACMAAGL